MLRCRSNGLELMQLCYITAKQHVLLFRSTPRIPFLVTVQREEKHIKAPYINNSRSMYNVAYDCVFYVCTKPALGNAQEH